MGNNTCKKYMLFCDLANQNGDCIISACKYSTDRLTEFCKPITISNTTLGKACIICGETVKLTENEQLLLEHGHTIGDKVCDKCKQAVLHMRKQLEIGG